MDMIQLLKDDHARAKRELQGCLQTIDQGQSVDQQKLQQVCQELQLHMRMEETYLYPRMEKEEDVQDLIQDSYEEHREARGIMDSLIQGKSGGSAMRNQIQQLLRVIEHHVQEEENQLFPVVQDVLGKEELQRLGDQMQQMKQQELSRMAR